MSKLQKTEENTRPQEYATLARVLTARVFTSGHFGTNSTAIFLMMEVELTLL